ncbi:MAG TPA: translocation/assembly module TamB domain-containing protein [Gemmatimonadaceae bacterium]|nr:translocation/assembly module TamB domain-containing protein [Gemmatimonadaceae bacterium]
MTRRRLVVLISAGIMLLPLLVVAGLFVTITQTGLGRETARDLLNKRLAVSLRGRGSMYIGHIGGNLLTGVVIDSFAIRDAEDSLFVSTGPITVTYDPRDLLDRRILLSTLDVKHPYIYLRRHADNVWNYRKIFPEEPKRRGPMRLPVRPVTPGLGDFIVVDSAALDDMTFVLTQPWSPDSWLHGAQRDSAVRRALADTSHEVRRTKEGLKKTMRWTEMQVRLPYLRVAHPDSAGRLIVIGNLDMVESDPPFKVRNGRGTVRLVGDSVWFSMGHFDMPASAGRANGKVWWNSTDPVHYDVHAVTDSISLSDVDWIYPGLPHTGGGRTNLAIKNDPKDLHVLDYVLTEMDLRSTKSHITGSMTFGVGAPVLQIKNLDLVADPLDFDLLRVLGQGPLPVDWQGQLVGTLKGPGGPLDRWQVTEGKFDFRDAHVKGAVSKLALRGGLNILVPSLAVFRGADVDVGRLDLRSIEYLFPAFPRLQGTFAGKISLDSVWTDVRFHGLDLTHTDGDGPHSHITGSGRLTNGKILTYDVDLQASPLSFTTLERSYPHLPLRGEYSGPMRLSGWLGDLDMATSLSGPAGSFHIDGHFDLDPAGGQSARGVLDVNSLDLATLLTRPNMVHTRLTGTLRADVHGDSLPNLTGGAEVVLGPSRVDKYEADSAEGRFRFADERVSIDTLQIASKKARLMASGALGLAEPRHDSVHYEIAADSLGGLRPYILPGVAYAAPEVESAGDSALPLTKKQQSKLALDDSLSGSLRLIGSMTGSLDSIRTHGLVSGDDWVIAGNEVRSVRGTYDLAGLPNAPRGTLVVDMDSVLYESVPVDSITAAITLTDTSNAHLTLRTTSSRVGGKSDVGAEVAVQRFANSFRIVVDSLAGRYADQSWTLTGPSTVVVDSGGLQIDSLAITSGRGSRLAISGAMPIEEPMSLSIVLNSFPLEDAGVFVKTAQDIGGTADAEIQVTGVRRRPIIAGTATLKDLTYGTLNLPETRLQTEYRRRRLRLSGELLREGTPALTLKAVVPVDLAFQPVAQRFLSDTLSGRIQADSVSLGLLEVLTTSVSRVTGTLSTDIRVGGNWRHPVLRGPITIKNGEVGLPRLGIRLRELNADAAFVSDSLLLRSISAVSGTDNNSKLTLDGSISAHNLADIFSDITALNFDLHSKANRFQAMSRMEITESLDLVGPFSALALSGTIRIDKATIAIQSLAQKEVIDLDSLGALIDTSALVTASSIWTQYPELKRARDNLRVPNLSVEIGPEVWLKSQEANIKLGGSVTFGEGTDRRITGSIRVERGSYRLDFGLVQRSFQVDSGTVTFYNDAQSGGELNIYASYVVRQANQLSQDVKILAHIQGTARAPRLTLSSDERYPLSYTEILNYIIFGEASVLGSNDVRSTNTLQTVSAALIPSVNALLQSAIQQQVSFFDYVQIESGGLGSTYANQSNNILASSRIGIGKQVTDRIFVIASAGLCGISGGSTGTDFFHQLGGSMDYRIAPGVAAQVTVEPSAAALQCKPGSQIYIGNTPTQVGFDLFREWAF